ncbi:something about silencing protein 10 [Drosophila nasuta]|uniref:something about silencing protein 10 n=1 Tax=Drosophila nasuta TaxID=42062 RepID=UPI00295F3BB8|nr:something about silencing protein 10 [Drosophila nasuta]
MDSEVDDYEPTDSEEEYNEEEREILQDYRKERQRRADNKRNQKQSVLAFSESDDDDDDEEEDPYAAQRAQRKAKKSKRKTAAAGNDDDDDDEDDVAQLMRDSDIEGAEDDDGDLPDTMDWGTNKRTYYNTDFVDQDYSSYNAQEEDMAKAEEEEAKKIQLRLAKQLNEADFQLDDMMESSSVKQSAQKAAKKSTTKSSMETIKVTTDLAGLGKRERLQLLQKDSPEFLGITQEFKRQLHEVQKLTAPVLNYVRHHQVPVVPALQFAQLYQSVLLSYCSNVSYYLLLKATRSNVKYHPVVKRLVQLKQLREQLAERYVEFIEPQLEALLERIQDGDAFTVLDVAQRKAKLQILDKYNETSAEQKQEQQVAAAAEEEVEDDDEETDDDDKDEDEDAAELARRGITYQMAKNKGLTPHRKKELRNPRVKHRGKYRKALIRRKGAVRSVRTEVKRYGGEVSGIKAGVTKSVKFRT